MPALDILIDKAIQAAIRATCAVDKARRLSDDSGLYIEAAPTGRAPIRAWP